MDLQAGYTFALQEFLAGRSTTAADIASETGGGLHGWRLHCGSGIGKAEGLLLDADSVKVVDGKKQTAYLPTARNASIMALRLIDVVGEAEAVEALGFDALEDLEVAIDELDAHESED